MKFIYSIVFAALFMVACNTEGENEKRPTGPVDHTVIMYLAGNNNLSSYLAGNVKEVMSALDGSTPGGNGRIVAFYSPSVSAGDPVLLELYYSRKNGPLCDTLKRYDRNISATSESTMRTVIADAMAGAPAAEYSIIFGSHATGWFTRECMSRGSLVSPLSADGGECGYGSFWRQRGDEITRTFGMDGSSDPGMNVSEIVSAFDGHRFRSIIFDACFMASAEVAYDLRESADYLIASSAEIMGRGMPYELILEYLFASGSVEDNLVKFCSEYIRFYSELTTGRKSGTISLIDLSAVENLAAAVCTLESAGLRDVDRDDVQAFELLDEHQFFDLEQYYELATTSDSAYADFQNRLSDCVIYAGHTPTVFSALGSGGYSTFPVERSCGLTVNIPSEEYPLFRSEWLATAWAKRIGR